MSKELQFDTAETLAAIAEATEFWLGFDAEALETLTSAGQDRSGGKPAGQAT